MLKNRLKLKINQFLLCYKNLIIYLCSIETTNLKTLLIMKRNEILAALMIFGMHSDFYGHLAESIDEGGLVRLESQNFADVTDMVYYLDTYGAEMLG